MMNSKKIILKLFFIIFFLYCCITIFAKNNIEKSKLYILNHNNVKILLNIEIASDHKTRTYGLMNRKSLDANTGMLFVFKREKYLNFWMKNVTIPLSIAYINKNGVIIDIQKMKPLDTTRLYPSKYPAKYALEVNQGWFKNNNIKIGNKVLLNGRVSK